MEPHVHLKIKGSHTYTKVKHQPASDKEGVLQRADFWKSCYPAGRNLQNLQDPTGIKEVCVNNAVALLQDEEEMLFFIFQNIRFIRRMKTTNQNRNSIFVGRMYGIRFLLQLIAQHFGLISLWFTLAVCWFLLLLFCFIFFNHIDSLKI